MPIETLENTIFNLIQDNLLYFTIIISAIIGKLKESAKTNIFTIRIMYFIGTLFHELAHLIVSIITYGKPTWFSILPSNYISSKKLINHKNEIIYMYKDDISLRNKTIKKFKYFLLIVIILFAVYLRFL